MTIRTEETNEPGFDSLLGVTSDAKMPEGPSRNAPPPDKRASSTTAAPSPKMRRRSSLMRDLHKLDFAPQDPGPNPRKSPLSLCASRAIEDLSVHHGGFQFEDQGDAMGDTNHTDCAEHEEWKLGDPYHDVTEPLGRIRNRCGAFINHRVASLASTMLILLNAIVLAAMTVKFQNSNINKVLETLDTVILSLFTIELSLQLFYLGLPELLRQRWLLFDLIIIIFSWAFVGSPVSVVRSFRIFRVFSLFSRWESMRNLVAAVGRTLPKMVTIWVALLLFFFVFCVLFTDLYGDLYEEGYLDYDYFGQLDKTFLTLFQFMTLDSWSAVVRQVRVDRPASLIAFCSWIIITAFFALNLVIAVICESLIELNNLKEKKNRSKALKKHQDMIAAQTEQLVEESQRILFIQNQMLKNQALMQQALLEIAAHMDRSTREKSMSTSSQGKGALSRLLSSLSDEDFDVAPAPDNEEETDSLANK